MCFTSWSKSSSAIEKEAPESHLFRAEKPSPYVLAIITHSQFVLVVQRLAQPWPAKAQELNKGYLSQISRFCNNCKTCRMPGPNELSKIHTVKNRIIKTSVSLYWRKKKDLSTTLFVSTSNGCQKKWEMISCFLTAIDSKVLCLNSLKFNLIRLTAKLHFRYLRSAL